MQWRSHSCHVPSSALFSCSVVQLFTVQLFTILLRGSLQRKKIIPQCNAGIGAFFIQLVTFGTFDTLVLLVLSLLGRVCGLKVMQALITNWGPSEIPPPPSSPTVGHLQQCKSYKIKSSSSSSSSYPSFNPRGPENEVNQVSENNNRATMMTALAMSCSYIY